MHRFFLIIICFFVSLCNAQLQNSKWYFGANAGLDFVTSPPTLITNTNVNTSGGMSSISNAAGTPVNSGTYSVLGVNINNCQSTKVFTVSVVPCTAMNVVSSNQVGIIIYPNPSRGIFVVEIKQRMQVSITDLSGSSVYKSQLAIGSHNIDLSKYADGIYLLEAANENGSQVIRLIKE